MTPKTFNLTLTVSQDDKGNYDVQFQHLRSDSATILTNTELDSIREGCVLMARELTQRFREEVYNATDTGFA